MRGKHSVSPFRLIIISALLLKSTLLFWGCGADFSVDNADDLPGIDTTFVGLVGDSIAPFSDLMEIEEVPKVDELFIPSQVKYLNFHATASPYDITAPRLVRFFIEERKWSRPGYNIYIRWNQTDTLVNFDDDGIVQYSELSNGVKGQNRYSINVAYAGGVDKQLNAKDTRTAYQKREFNRIYADIKCKFPWIEVRGHRDHKDVKKACPSFEVSDEYH